MLSVRTVYVLSSLHLFLLIGWELDGGGQPNNPHKSGHGTIKEALAASAEAFTDLPDRF